MNTAAGCREQALRFRGPDPCPLLATIGELDWEAEAVMIEREMREAAARDVDSR